MEQINKIAKITDFIAQGDDSFIDDAGMTNRWAIRRREQQRRVAEAEAARQRQHPTFTVADEHTAAIDTIRRLLRENEERQQALNRTAVNPPDGWITFEDDDL